MAETSTATRDRIVVDVAEDALKAYLRMVPDGSPDPPTEAEVIDALTKAEIAINDTVQTRVAEFLELTAKNELPDEPFILAEGTLSVEGKSETLEWEPQYVQQCDEWKGDEAVNYYEISSIVTVEKDALIGTITPIEPARDGVDVKGKKIPASGEPKKLVLADSVRVTDDNPKKIVANLAGKVTERNDKISIQEVIVIANDVGFDTGNLDVPTDVRIGGAVPDRFSVISRKSIVVTMAIEAARIDAGEDVVVGRGILGRNEGVVNAGGQIIAKYASEAALKAGTDVKIASQVLNSRVWANGQFIAEVASVIGGNLYAQDGVRVASLGSDADIKTRIFVGLRPDRLKEASEIEASLHAKRDAITRIRETIKPLMDNLKRLAAKQREQATELMFKADEAEAQIAEEEERREKLLALPGDVECPRIYVNDTIYPGVTLSFGNRVTSFTEETKGPIYIEERKLNNVTELVAVNSLTGSLQVLTCHKPPLDDLLVEFKPLLDMAAESEPVSDDDTAPEPSDK